jgi:hypothetical protein
MEYQYLKIHDTQVVETEEEDIDAPKFPEYLSENEEEEEIEEKEPKKKGKERIYSEEDDDEDEDQVQETETEQGPVVISLSKKHCHLPTRDNQALFRKIRTIIPTAQITEIKKSAAIYFQDHYIREGHFLQWQEANAIFVGQIKRIVMCTVHEHGQRGCAQMCALTPTEVHQPTHLPFYRIGSLIWIPIGWGPVKDIKRVSVVEHPTNKKLLIHNTYVN